MENEAEEVFIQITAVLFRIIIYSNRMIIMNAYDMKYKMTILHMHVSYIIYIYYCTAIQHVVVSTININFHSYVTHCSYIAMCLYIPNPEP